MKETIQYDDFTKLDMRLGTIKECVGVEGSEKLLRMQVDFGELGVRQILSGIAKWYSSEDLVGVQCLFVVNLEPRKMMGYESHGMLLAVGEYPEEKPILLITKEPVADGVGAN